MDPFALWKVIPGAGDFLRVALPFLLFIIVVVIGWGIFEEWLRNPRTGKRGWTTGGGRRQMTAEEKGWVGEERVQEVLAGLDPDAFFLRFGLHLLVPGGKSTQIDALVFSRFGIFVIEVKNWGGVVHGGRTQKNWTVRYSGKRRKWYNPLRQNDQHITALHKITSLPRDVFHSLVVLAGDAKVDLVDDAKSKEADLGILIHLDELKNYIAGRREEILSEDEFTQAIADTMRAEDNSPDAAERHKASFWFRR